jgi:hypothetical protein
VAVAGLADDWRRSTAGQMPGQKVTTGWRCCPVLIVCNKKTIGFGGGDSIQLIFMYDNYTIKTNKAVSVRQ